METITIENVSSENERAAMRFFEHVRKMQQENWTQKSIADLCKISEATLSQWLAWERKEVGKKTANPANSPQLFRCLERINNALGLDEDKHIDTIYHMKPIKQTGQIPVYNINCVTPKREEAQPISHMTPCPQFPEADFAIYMEDYHVMKNSLPEGSVIGIKNIDHRSKFIKSGHIYLMWWEHEGLVVRYAYLDQTTKEVKCIADHDDQEKFPPQFFPVEQAQNFVVGRVVWCLSRV